VNATGWVEIIGAITACITAAGGLIIAIIKVRTNATINVAKAMNSTGNSTPIPPAKPSRSTP
jgi:hypothetical protein